MKIKKLRIYFIASLVAISLFACVDNAYDLSDIDSSVGVKVNDLVIPLNLDAITLQDMFNLDDDSQVKEINGEYALLEVGNFESDPIEVPSFIIPAPDLSPISATLNLTSYGDLPSLDDGLSPIEIEVPNDDLIFDAQIEEISISFNLESQNIDAALVEINEIGTEFIMKLSFNIEGNIDLSELLKDIEIENLEIELPKGLTTTTDEGEYNPETGRLKFDETLFYNIENGKEITLSVSKINTEQAGLELIDSELKLDTKCKIISGRFAIYGRNLTNNPVNITQLLSLKNITYHLDFNFPNDEIKITDFTGVIRYQFDAINVSSIIIDNLPDLLNQEGTNISISNPQIYISINNPLYNDYQLEAKTGVELIPTPKSNLTFKSEINFDKADNKFCLSPVKPEKMYVENSEYVAFSNLGNILSGDGIPNRIDIEITETEVPQQKVNNFKLGQNLGIVKGKYDFYVPFALTDEAQIHYTDTIDGWGDDELEKLIVDRLGVESKIESDIPFGFTVVAFPIDKNGKELTKDGQPIRAILKSKKENETIDRLPAFANTTILFDMEGPLKNLDGIIFKATLTGAEGNHSLKSNQRIQLKDIKLKVSGEYIDEF